MYLRHLVILLLSLLVCSAQALPPLVFHVAEPLRPAWMLEDKALKAEVVCDLNGQPLKVVLEALRTKTGVAVRAGSDIEEHRVALHIGPTPLWQVMARLQDLFRHRELTRNTCYWYRKEGKDGKVEYALNRSSAGKQQESDLLDGSAMAIRWLKQMRDYSLLPPEKRKLFQTDWLYLQTRQEAAASLFEKPNCFAEVVSTMTDSQIEDLIHLGKIDLPDFTPSQSVVDYIRSATLANDLANERQTPANPPPLLGASLYTEPGIGSDSQIHVRMNFMSGSPNLLPAGMALDVFGVFDLVRRNAELEEAQKTEVGPEVDLLASQDTHSL